MDQTKCTPRKGSPNSEQSLSTSPVIYKTPLKQCKFRQKTSSIYQGSMGSFTVLANHITPKSGLTKFIARNPFDADLTNRLHLSVISPTVFNKVSPKSQDSPFAWTIDELATIKPAKIEESPMQQTHYSDPEIEMKAQEAINQFFSQNSIHPSPWNEKREPIKSLICMTPTRKIDGLIANNDISKTTKDCWSQTVLSLPPELPTHVEEALAPYFTFTQDQNIDNDDANSSNNSLRRKLFFCHDESTEDECSLILSPIKGDTSPPQSGMFAHGTPLTKGTLALQRTYGTPCINSENLSPPNMSPICNSPGDMSCQSIGSRCKSAARLDFNGHMSVDTSFADNNDNQKYHQEDDEGNNLDHEQENGNGGTEKSNDTIEMVSLLHESTPSRKTSGNNYKILGKLKDAVDWYKSVSNENDSGQRNITLIGYSEQSGAFSINHDTGYQTCSMNNTSANPDNRSMTPSKKAFNWNERINGLSEINESDAKGLRDWQENIETMISSTPSKNIRQREL
ncbi:hypothetical protein PV327_004973 [Microctonus hyperodae]|uniref:Protein aurora borealis n=1 Tax=Microctonus hyperodae TaxID=165561 RepID=A0AA39FDK5_MICHY|nr:hypothetical protein PV327_004973 [Microctonus hyperodae]